MTTYQPASTTDTTAANGSDQLRAQWVSIDGARPQLRWTRCERTG